MKLDQVLRYRWLIATVFFFSLALSFLGAISLEVNPNNRVFFGPGDNEYSDLLDFEAHFGSNTNLLIGTYSQAGDIFTDPQLVEATKWLSGQAWRVDGVTRVDSLASYPFGKYSPDEIELTTLSDEFCQKVCRLDAKSELLREHLVNRFVSADGRMTAVIASVVINTEDSFVVSQISEQTANLIKEAEHKFPSQRFYLTGAVPMMQAFLDASNSDLRSLILVAVLLFLVLLGLFLGKLLLTGALIGLGLASIFITLGIAGWFGHTVNTATATLPLVVFTLVVAGSMHIFLYVARDACSTRSEVRAAIDRAYAANSMPVIVAAATSMVGLLSLVFVSAPPIKQLGVFSAIGVLIGTLLLFTVVPLVLSQIKEVRPPPALRLVQRILNNRARKIERRVNSVYPFVAFFIFCIACISLIKIDEDFVRYFGEESRFRFDSEAITRSLSGPYHAEISIDTGFSGGIYEPQVIDLVQRYVGVLRSDRAVVNVLSISDVLAEVAEALSGRDAIVGLGSEELAQYFLSFELALEKGQSTTDFVDVDHRRVRVSVLFGDVSMAEIRNFESRAREKWLKVGGSASQITITGEGIPTAYLSTNSIQQLSTGIGFSLVFSSCLIGLLYRSIRVSIVVLSAIALPVIAGFGVWGLVVGEIGMAATLVVAVTIGVVIDDAIHLLYRFRDGTSSLGLSPAEAAAYSIHRTASAITTTSIVLAGGFSVLMLSDFRMNSAFGACAALVIGLALVYNTTLTPGSLIWASRSGTS